MQVLTPLFSGHPATNDCLGALLATTLGFWYFMFVPSEAVASMVFLRRRSRHPPASNGKMGSCLSSRLSFVPLCRTVGAPHSRHRRPAPNAPASDSVPMHSSRPIRASVSVHARPAPIAMAFVGPVLVHSSRPIGASVSMHARSAMSASGFHPSLLSHFFSRLNTMSSPPFTQILASLPQNLSPPREKFCRAGKKPSSMPGMHPPFRQNRPSQRPQ